MRPQGAVVPDLPLVDVRRWPQGITVAATGRHEVAGDPYGSSNLAGHVGDRPERVTRNRARLQSMAESMGARSPLVLLRAEHGVKVEVVGPPFLTADPDGRAAAPSHTDAAVTARAGVPLVAMAADCVPVALADPSAGVIAVVHAGWRGCAAGTARAALEAMTDLGADPMTVRAYLGPAVCGACYAVGPEVVEALGTAAEGDRRAWHRRGSDGRPTVDLRAYLSDQLIREGLRPERIEVSGRCTVEDPALFSHRRDGRPVPTGRQGVLIVRRDG